MRAMKWYPTYGSAMKSRLKSGVAATGPSFIKFPAIFSPARCDYNVLFKHLTEHTLTRLIDQVYRE